jgi:hypothetical protein
MSRMVAVAVALVLALSLTAWAGETAGTIQTVDNSERTIVLEDGTKLWVAEGLPMENLKEGVKVKVAYEERDGKKVVSSIEVE